MVEISLAEFEKKVRPFGFCMEHVEDSSSIRIKPPSPCLLLTVPLGTDQPLALSPLWGEINFFCVGREPNIVHPFILSCGELTDTINRSYENRSGTSDDFYAIPDTGSSMIYVSHHDEVLMYFGWRTTER